MTSSSPSRRRHHESAQIGDLIYLFGGRDDKKYYFPRSQIHVFDIPRQTWDLRNAGGPNIPPPCIKARCVVIDGLIYSYGGRTEEKERLYDVYCLDPNKMKWDLVDTWSQGVKPRGRYSHCLCSVGSRVIMFGGYPFDDKVYELKLDGRKKGVWVKITTSGKGPRQRFGAAMAEIDDFRALLHGGHKGGYHDDFFIIDLAKRSWNRIMFKPAPSGRDGHILCRLKNRILQERICFLLMGGFGTELPDSTYILDFGEQKVFEMNSVEKLSGGATAHCVQNEDGTADVFGFGGEESRALMTVVRFGPRNKEYTAIESKILSAKASSELPEKVTKDNNLEKKVQRHVLSALEEVTDSKSTAEQIIYERALQSGSIKVERMRLLFVGQDGSGKTSLIRSLLSKPFDEMIPSTDGVAIDVAVTDAEKWQEQTDADGARVKCLECGFYLVTTTENEPSAPVDSPEEKAKALPSSSGEASARKKIEEIPASLIPTMAQGEGKRDEELEVSSTPQQTGGKPSLELQSLMEESEQAMASLDQYVRMAKKLAGMENLQITHLWELGGQETYLSTHCSLLPGSASRNALTAYIAVVNLALPLGDQARSSFRLADGSVTDCTRDLGWIEKNEDFLRAWLSNFSTAYPDSLELQSIQPRLGAAEEVANPPVFIAGTHFDHQTAKDILEEQIQSVAEIVEAKHYEAHIVCPSEDVSGHLLLIDNTKSIECRGVRQLRESIDQMRKAYYANKKPQPFRWILLEFLLSCLKKNKPIIKMALLTHLAIQRCGLSDEKEVALALSQLEGLGIILKFPDVPRLADEVFIDPEWVVKILAAFVTAKRPGPLLMKAWHSLQRTGMMSKELVSSRLAAAKVPEEMKDITLDLLHCLNVTSPVSSGRGAASDIAASGDLFIPCLLTTKYADVTLFQQSDPSGPFPPPLMIIPQNVDAVPEALFFRLVNRFLRTYDASESRLSKHRRTYDVSESGLSRHRCLFHTAFYQIELLYAGRGKALALTVGGDPAFLQDSWVREVKKLRVFFEKQFSDVRQPGMSGFSYEMRYYFATGNAAERVTIMNEFVYKLFEDPHVRYWLANEKGDKPKREWADKVHLWLEIEQDTGDVPTQEQMNIHSDVSRFDEYSNGSLGNVQTMPHRRSDNLGHEAALNSLKVNGKESVEKRGPIEADRQGMNSGRETDDDIKVTDGQLTDLHTKIHHKWEVVGRKLGLHNYRIEGIASERNTNTEKCIKMLRMWSYQQSGGQGTVFNLLEILFDVDVDLGDAAKDVFDISLIDNFLRWRERSQ